MRSKKLISIMLFLVLAAALVPIGFTALAQSTEEEFAPNLFIGTVTDNENIFVGLAVDGEDVTLYICDGNPEDGTVSIAQWFVGKVTDDAIAITADNGNSVEAAITEESVTGAFTFTDGSSKDFALIPAADKASLYRSEFILGDEKLVGGWLVLADGTVRGAFSNVIKQTLTPASIMVIAVDHIVGGPPAGR